MIVNEFLKMSNEKWTGNKIGAEGAKKISELLKVNTALTKLDLSCNWNTRNWWNEL